MLVETETNLSEADFKRVSELVYRHCGINLHAGKQELVRARLAKRLRATGSTSISRYLDAVEADPGGEEFTALIDAISTNLTSFYRESEHFRFLAEQGVPSLIDRQAKRGTPPRVRIWSAGCSTGEEPYTLAMVLLDTLSKIAPGARPDVKILATDISTNVLRIAKRGFYIKSRLDTLPAGYAQRYFEPATMNDEKGFVVAPAVRELIAFRHLNLMEPWPFTGPFDFIFCRNVMIYFDKPTQQRLVGRYWDVLGTGGVLFTGHSESLTGIEHKFKYVQPTIYGKQ